MQGSFAYLVRQDCARLRRNGVGGTSPWVLFYGALIVLIGIGAVTYFSLQNRYEPLAPMFITFGMPYMVFMVAYSMFHREWKNGTVGWWLTLPYTRLKLMAAKYVAALIQSLFIYVAVVVLIALLAMYSALLSGTADSDYLITMLMRIGGWFVISISVIPFMAAFGLLTAAIMTSRLKPLAPIVWIVFGLSGNMGTWTGIYTEDGIWQQITEGPAWLQLTVPVSFLLGALFLWLSARIVERQLTL